MLGLLCYAHTGLCIASQIQQPPIKADRFDRAMVQGKALRQAGQCEEAIKVFRSAAEIAHASKKIDQQAQALLTTSGCEIRLFQYAAALKTIEQARTLAMQVDNKDVLGGISNNRASIYSALGDFRAAEQAAEQGIQVLSHSSRKDYFILALLTKGDIKFGLSLSADGTIQNVSPEAKAAFTQAIETARSNKLPDLEARAADNFGIWLVLSNDLAHAEALLNRALQIRQVQGDKNNIAVSQEHLAELNLRKGKTFLHDALTQIDQALSSKSIELQTGPRYYPTYIRGQILLHLGQKEKALSELRQAVDLADVWRQSALPGDTTNIHTAVALHDVYHGYAELAAELALKNNNQVLAADAFEVLARNRAASLREQLTRSYSRKFLLSPSYFELLQQLQMAQAAVTLENNPAQSVENIKKLAQIRAELSELENKSGLEHNFLPSVEINRHRISLKSIQSKIGGNEALLSFSLGRRKSFLWTVTNSELRLHELPSQELIEKQAIDFSRAISEKRGNRDVIGRAFSSSLFNKVNSVVTAKTHWFLTVDGKLLDKIPFSALPIDSVGDTAKPLGIVHTIRFLPSAFFLTAPKAPKPSERFVGVGDPIYNRADSRREPTSNTHPVQQAKSLTLPRLIGSGLEIQAAAKATSLTNVELLAGKKASGADLRRALETGPEILHFAVHVVSPKDRPEEAALALSLSKNEVPELLTVESVATYRTPGSLVVLSGCSSQQGEVLPSAGLIGLSRAWLLAGASAVIVSAWPTPDDNGQFFSSFYSHFQKATGSIARRAAIALQQTQSEMQAGGGYRSDASFWAAYSIISKE